MIELFSKENKKIRELNSIKDRTRGFLVFAVFVRINVSQSINLTANQERN
ncbi:hypothetical protein VCRA2119O147_5880001 [Vibrio crassostreae]|nr:hypothetical protein VCRA2119O147_5880001 [Vibrio crassostreae]